jgi:hypothetical protein
VHTLFMTPFLMTYRWRKQMLNATDLKFFLKAEFQVWDSSNHEPLGFFIYLPLCRHNLGVCGILQQWWGCKAPCVVCHNMMISYRKGIFCAIFWSKRENWMPCQKAWCASWYMVPQGSRFPIRLPKEEDGNVFVNEEDKTRFFRARVGDHVLCPFQCELCHFRNMQGRSPMKGTGVLNDAETIDLIRRANLDAFWSREATTIGHNLSKINRVLQIYQELGLDKPPVLMVGP